MAQRRHNGAGYDRAPAGLPGACPIAPLVPPALPFRFHGSLRDLALLMAVSR